MIECGPIERLEVEKVAIPLELSTDEPRVVVPSLNVTLPVGVPVPDVGATVAVNVTFCPNVDGLALEDTVVLVAAWFTVCDRIAEVLLK